MQDDKKQSVTIPLEARVDVRAIATLALYFMGRGTSLHTRSSIIRTTIEEYAKRVVLEEGATPIRSVAEAYRFMDKHGFTQKSRTMSKDFFAAILEEAGEDEMLEEAKKIQESINTKTTNTTNNP